MGVEAVVRLGKRLGAAEMFWDDAGTHATEVEGISFVGSTSEVCCPHSLCNLQNLFPVPP